MILSRTLRSLSTAGAGILRKQQKPLAAVIAVGLGLLLGSLIGSPALSELTLSVLVIFLVMIAVIHNPLHGILLWLFFEPFIETWVEIPLGDGLPDLSFSRFMVAFLSVFMLARAATGRFRFAPLSLADISIVATTLGIMVAAPLSVEPLGVIQWSISMHLTPLSIYFFTKNLVRNRNDLQKLLFTIALLGTVAAIYAAYENATGNVLFVPKEKMVSFLYRQDSGIRVIRGLLGGSGDMGRALAAVIPVTFYLFLERKRNDSLTIPLVGMLAVQFYGIVITMARAPWYALLIALFVMQLFYPRFRRLFFVIVLVGAIVIWATWDQVVDSDVNQRINDETSTLESREARWSAGFNMWKAKPVWGWGFGRFETQAWHFRTDGVRENFRNGAVENDYLYILVGGGLIGLLPYLLFILAPLVNSLRLFFRARAPNWSGFIKPETLAVYWAVILCLLITSYTAKQVRPIIKMMTFAVAGAVVGSHEGLLKRSKAEEELRYVYRLDRNWMHKGRNNESA